MSEGDSEYLRTIRVTNVPDQITENKLMIYFQRKRNGGGEVKEIQTFPDVHEARLVFEDAAVAENVLKREHNLCGVQIGVQRYAKKMDESVPTEVKTVLVSDLPEGITENQLTIHFQKKKNSGGEVQGVTLYPDRREALVVFESYEVANAVVTREQKVKDKLLKVEKYKQPRKEVKHKEISKEARTVVVSDIPEGIKESNLHIHFQKKKNGGGEIQEVKFLPGRREALVVFEDPDVASAVINREQIIQGKVVKLSPPKREGQDQHIPKKTRVVVVSNLPPGVRKNELHIHFQKRKNGGGEVSNVKMAQDGRKALVSFEDPEVAHAVINKEQKIRGKVVEVTPLDKDSKKTPEQTRKELVSHVPEPTKHFFDPEKKLNSINNFTHREELCSEDQQHTVGSEDSEEFITMGKVINVPIYESPRTENKVQGLPPTAEDAVYQRTILVSDIPDDVKESDVIIYFQRKNNNGGEVEKAKMFPDDGKALVVFAEPQVAERVLRKRHELNSKPVRVEKYNPSPKETEVVHVFTVVTATLNHALFQIIEPGLTKAILDETQMATGIQWHHAAYGLLVTGTLDQVKKAGDFIQSKLGDKCWQQPNVQNFDQSMGSYEFTVKTQGVKHGESQENSAPPSDSTMVPGRESSYRHDGFTDNFPEKSSRYRDMKSSRKPFDAEGDSPESRGQFENFENLPQGVSNTASEITLENSDASKNNYEKYQFADRRTLASQHSSIKADSLQSGSQNPIGVRANEKEKVKPTPIVRKNRPQNNQEYDAGQQGPDAMTLYDFQQKSGGLRTKLSNDQPSTKTGRLVQGIQELPDRSTEQTVVGQPIQSQRSASVETEEPRGPPERRQNAAKFSSVFREERSPSMRNDSVRTESNDSFVGVAASSSQTGTADKHNNVEEGVVSSSKLMSNEKEVSNDNFQSHPKNPEEASFDGRDFDGDNLHLNGNNSRQASLEQSETDSSNFREDHNNSKKSTTDIENPHEASLDMVQDSLRQMNLQEKPSSVSVAQFIQHVYKDDLEQFKSLNRVDVVLTEDKKRLTLKPMRGFNQSEMNEVEKKLQQFYTSTSRRLTTATIDLRQFTAEEADRIKKSMMRQRDRSEVMIEESDSDVFSLVGDTETVEMFRRNVVGARRRDSPVSESNKTMPAEPMVATRKGVRVVLMRGEIQKQECGAIVNFTDSDLVHKSGLSYAIREAAGEAFWKECRDIIAKNGSLVSNMVTTTTAGSLSCQQVIHAILPDLSKDRRQEVLRHGLKETCRLALNKAKDSQLKSICFPVITSDIANLPSAVSSRLLFEVIKDFIENNSPLNNNFVEEVRIVFLKNTRGMEDYIKEFTKNF